MSRIVARPVFGLGWGRCTTILSLPIRSPIRDPERSTISTPQARNMASRSRHRMFDGVGVAKMRSSTLRCLVLTVQGTAVLVLNQVPPHSIEARWRQADAPRVDTAKTAVEARNEDNRHTNRATGATS